MVIKIKKFWLELDIRRYLFNIVWFKKENKPIIIIYLLFYPFGLNILGKVLRNPYKNKGE